jgi:hypothetical protein
MTRDEDPMYLKLLGIACALYETVREAGFEGAPSGPMYLACQEHNIDLDTYERIMAALVNKGLIRKSNHVYYFVQKKEE